MVGKGIFTAATGRPRAARRYAPGRSLLGEVATPGDVAQDGEATRDEEEDGRRAHDGPPDSAWGPHERRWESVAGSSENPNLCAARRPLGKPPDRLLQHRTCPACLTRGTPASSTANPSIPSRPARRSAARNARRLKPRHAKSGTSPDKWRTATAPPTPVTSPETSVVAWTGVPVKHPDISEAWHRNTTARRRSAFKHLPYRLQERNEPKRLFDGG